MPTNPGTIPAPTLPAPDPGDKPTFAARMSSQLAWLRGAMYTAINSVASASYDNAVEAAASAQTAIDAAAGVAAPAWTAATYAVGDARYSPINQLLYRCILAGASATDPANDATRWQLMLLEATEVIVSGTAHTAAHNTLIKLRSASATTVTMPALATNFRCYIKVENARADNKINWGGALHEDSSQTETVIDNPYQFVKVSGSNVWRVSDA